MTTAERLVIINKIAAIEAQSGLLSGDMVHQDDLFDAQEKLCQLLIWVAGESSTAQLRLTTKLPYLFSVNTPKEIEQ